MNVKLFFYFLFFYKEICFYLKSYGGVQLGL